MRWEGEHAIVDDAAGAEHSAAANVDARAYMRRAELLTARLKVLQAREREMRRRLESQLEGSRRRAPPAAVPSFEDRQGQLDSALDEALISEGDVAC